MLDISSKRRTIHKMIAGLLVVVLACAVSAVSPRTAFAARPDDEVGQTIWTYVQLTSYAQPSISRWDPNLHCFSGKPNADDAILVGDNGISDEYWDEDSYGWFVPLAVVERSVAESFPSIPDLREWSRYSFEQSTYYDASKNAFFFSYGGKGAAPHDVEIISCAQQPNGTYDAYFKVSYERLEEAPIDMSNQDDYALHHMRFQRNGEGWRYLSFELIDPKGGNAFLPFAPEGDTGISIKGSLDLAESGDVSIRTRVIDKDSFDVRFKVLENLLNVLEVDLEVDGIVKHDGFGKMEISFPVGKENDGYWIIIHHLHQNGEITSDRAIAKNGTVELEVTDLSSFALERGSKAVSESPSSSLSSDHETEAVGYSLEDIEAPADGTTTMISPRTGQSPDVNRSSEATLAILLVLGLSAAVVSRKFVRDQRL